MEIVFGVLVVITAYFVKGFSGFGPALILVPFFTLLYDPSSALLVAAFFDFFAGSYLFFSVRKEIRWSFVLSVFIALAAGTFLGTMLLGQIPVEDLKKVIGAVILVFAGVILFQRNGNPVRNSTFLKYLKYPAGFLSGFLGGLVSMSGPPIVIYMKMMYQKSFFRTQLIALFLLGTSWRSLLFIYHDIPMNIPFVSLGIYFIMMFLGLWLGRKSHLNVNELVFNKIVAVLLFIPAFNLLLS